MDGFRNYLIEKGYKPHLMDYDKVELVPGRVPYFSTMKSVYNLPFLVEYYVKGDIIILYGLNEVNHPPTLIYRQFHMIKVGENIQRLGEIRDYDMDKIFKIHTFDEIHDAYVTNTMHLLLNK